MFKIMFYVQAILALVTLFALAAAPRQKIDVALCGPDFTLTKTQCQRRIYACYIDYGLLLKWTGIGTRFTPGKPEGDGGCQCDEYCGYRSRKPCTSDDQCRWDDSIDGGFCVNRATGDVGAPMPECEPA